MNKYDFIIIGAGLYGLFTARLLSKKNKVLVIEREHQSFLKASYVNQARLHNGYHYPRSIETASMSHDYFERFQKDFSDSINKSFDKIYAISKWNSKTSCEQYESFCSRIGIPLKRIPHNKLFKPNMIEKCYLAKEYSYDYIKVRDQLLDNQKYDILFNSEISCVQEKNNQYVLNINNKRYLTDGIINTTYSSINQINKLFCVDYIDLKYELCEMIMCDVPPQLEKIGITVLDGNFFSIMPFGLQGHHSLYSVYYTIHDQCLNPLPELMCQSDHSTCNQYQLNNCNSCFYKPKTSFQEIKNLFEKYLLYNDITYKESIFAIKVVMQNAEADDSRMIHFFINNKKPFFMSIFSGKVNSIYEIEKKLKKYI